MAKRCLGCMKLKENSPICEHCGYNENVPNYPNQLPVGTILRGSYTVGKVLGQGGFGITYIGWDHSLESVVAIKEFYPSGVVNRDGQTVSCNGKEAEMPFSRNRERFLKEAKILAKLQNVPGVVRVQNLFSENNTVYIVMEYVKGIDLRQYIRMQNRALTEKEILPLLRPVLYALHKVHGAGLIHRDIAPDNIMILPDGTAKLLDFGAAREVEPGQAAMESTEAILKHGFAPIEQYSRRGNLGPWTDVYALCATIYYCLTGKLPDSAAERVMGEDSVDWKTVPGLTEQQIATLEKGMELLPEGRLQSMEELFQGLYSQPSGTSAQAKTPEKAPVKDMPKTRGQERETPKVQVKPAAPAAGFFLMKPKKEAPTVPAETRPAVMEVTEPTVPAETLSPEDQKKYDEAVALESSSKKAEAAMAFGKLGDILDARERSFNLWAEVTERKTIAAGCDFTAAVRKDGTVVFDGWMDENWREIEEWEDVIALSASIGHLVGLKSDGTVVAAGRNQDGQCNVSDWKNIVAVCVGADFTAGLQANGEVVIAGNYAYNGAVSDACYWMNIVAISAGETHIVGLKSDGTVVCAGRDVFGETKVSGWSDIVKICAGDYHTLGLKADGTVVSVGRNAEKQREVSSWKDIVAIAAGYGMSVGLKSDGSIVVAGGNANSFSNWTGIQIP